MMQRFLLAVNQVQLLKPPQNSLVQCFLLAAMKFHCHCAALPARGAASDARCAFAAIEAGIAFVHSAASRGGGVGSKVHGREGILEDLPQS